MSFRSLGKLKIVWILILIFGVVSLVLQLRAEYAVENFLKRKIPGHLQLTYDELNVNFLMGNLGFENVSLKIKNRDSLQIHTVVRSEAIQIEGFRYLQLMFKKTIAIEALILQKPTLKYYPYKYIRSEKAKSKGMVSLLKTIVIDKLDIQEGNFQILKDDIDSVQVAIKSYDFTLYEGRTDPELVAEKIPLSYESYELKADSIFADLGQFETLTVRSLLTTESEFEIKDIHLESKYSKRELSQHLKKERDYVNLKIPEVTLVEMNFGFTADRFGIAMDAIKIKKPKVEFYRDKFLPDDVRPKSLYSKLLRELPLDITIGNAAIESGNLVYQEKPKNRKEAGTLTFEKLNATLKNITNDSKGRKTVIKANTQIMGHAPLAVEWSFDVNATSDNFNISGSLKNLEAERLNTFLEPNLRTRARGTIQEMYFTFDGNALQSQGAMKMKYEDFKFNILNKDRLGINKVLTSLGNLFVNDGSKTDSKGYRHGTMTVEREINKSFFNYLWSNVREGIISTLTGKGVKEYPKKED